jgi:hypothetical protein
MAAPVLKFMDTPVISNETGLKKQAPVLKVKLVAYHIASALFNELSQSNKRIHTESLI